MGMLRIHLQQMKQQDPKEYDRLIKTFGSEEELIREALGLTEKAMKHYEHMKEVPKT